MATITIAGFPATTKRPGARMLVTHGAGALSVNSQPKTLLLVGGKRSAGTATVDVSVVDVLSETDADTYFGSGSELATMCYAALRTGLNVKGAPVADNGSPTAATATITVTGTWTAAGSVDIIICGGAGYAGGDTLTVTVAASDSVTNLADRISAAVQAKSQLVCSGANVSGVVTLTAKTTGTVGNSLSCYVDQTNVPSGCVVTLTGGTALASQGTTVVGKRFIGGAGARDLTNILAVLEPGDYDTIAFADNDATNAARVKTWIATRAGIGVEKYSHAVYAKTTSYSTPASLASSTLNDVREMVLWMNEGESSEAVLAASAAATIQLSDQDHPNQNFDGVALAKCAPHRYQSQRPTAAQIETALNNGVSVIDSPAGAPAFESLITSHCLSGAASDYRTYDHGAAKVPDRIAQTLQLHWSSEVTPAYPNVRDNPEEGDPPVPDGVLTPDLYAEDVTKILQEKEAERWLIDVSDHPPVVQYNASGRHLLAVIDIEPAPINHRVGANIRNVTAA